MEIEIVGAEGRVDPDTLIGTLTSLEAGEVLAVDADMVCGSDHLLSAAIHACRAFRRGSNSANTVAMETLLYASGERQISRAMEKMRVSGESTRIGLVLFDVHDANSLLSRLGLERRDDVLAASHEKLSGMGIDTTELDILPEEIRGDLALEMVAFVDLLKR